MAELLIGEYSPTVTSDYRILIRKKDLLEKMNLDEKRRCIFAGMSEDCVSLWSYEAWHEQVQPYINVILERRLAVVQLTHLEALCQLSPKVHEDTIDDRGRVRLPEEFRHIVELEPYKEKEKQRRVVVLVGSGPCVLIYRRSTFQELRKRLWPRFWEAIDAVKSVTPMDS